jgi:hypothetical protein
MIARISILSVLVTILGVLIATLVVPMVQGRIDDAKDHAAMQRMIDDGARRGY